MPSSGACRSASAVTVPRPLKRCESPPLSPALEPPSKAISPPSVRALAALMVKPRCEKSTRPFAADSSGVSGVMRTSLPASASVPLTIESPGRASGMFSASLSSAAPVAVVAGERLAGPATERRDVDEAQHVGERAARGAVDLEAGAAAELGDAALDAAPLDVADLRPAAADVERRAIDDDLARRRRSAAATTRARGRRRGRAEPGSAGT